MSLVRHLSLTVLLLLLASLPAPVIVSAETPTLEPRSTAPGQATTIGYAWLVLSAEQLPWLIGADIRSLHLAACINGGLVAGEVYVLPRGLSPSFEAELNKTTYVPVYGSTRVKENDLLLLLVPYSPVNLHSLFVRGSVAKECGWGRHYALLRLHNRVKVVVKSLASLGRALLWHSPRALAPRGLEFYIYFDRDRGRGSPVYPSSVPDMALVTSLARRLGIAPGNNTAWYTRLRTILRERAESAHLEAVVEKAKGWIMSSDYSRVVEVLRPLSSGRGPRRLPSSINYIDGGGSGSLRFYWFTLSLDPGLPSKPVELAPGEKLYPSTIYLGPYVEDVGLHVRVENNSSQQACVEVGLFVYRYESGSQGGHYDATPLVAIDRRYLVSPGSVSAIEVEPSNIPWSGTKLGARPFVRNCGGASIEVLDATLDFLKSYPSMPVEEQRQGLEILSYGIKIIDPRGSRVAKYVETDMLPGLYFVAGLGDNRFSFSFSYPEGVYLDYNYGDDGATLVLDV
ncbi:MAG: hypothetical protein LRS48_05440, partial [Desulfurococcales archaeon]|nr:hypothetical protein [Desulfurococcales archaeon]